jgi:hypothetical protein
LSGRRHQNRPVAETGQRPQGPVRHDRGRPASARARPAHSALGWPPWRPDTGSGTSPSRSSWRPCTGGWPTTPWAGSSTDFCGRTWSWSTSWGCAPRPHRGLTTVPVRGRGLRAAEPRSGLPLPVRGVGPVPPRAHHRGVDARPAAAPRGRGRHRWGVLPDARGETARRWPFEANLRWPGRDSTWPKLGTSRWPLTGGAEGFRLSSSRSESQLADSAPITA